MPFGGEGTSEASKTVKQGSESCGFQHNQNPLSQCCFEPSLYVVFAGPPSYSRANWGRRLDLRRSQKKRNANNKRVVEGKDTNIG